MNSKKKLLAGAGLFILIFFAASAAYQKLAGSSAPNLLQAEKAAEGTGQEKETVPAFDFTVQDPDGNPVQFSSLLGEKPVILNFWSSKCPPCRQEMPDFEAAYQKWGDAVHFVMVDSIGALGETEELGRKWIEDQGFTFPVYYDTEQDAMGAYGVTRFPSSYFIDAAGNITAVAQGMLNAENLQKGIDMITSSGPAGESGSPESGREG